MLAILAAITEVIKENKGTGTPVEYYGALVSFFPFYCTWLYSKIFQLTTLDKLFEASEPNEDQVTAVLSLLNMGIKAVPEPILKKGFNDITLKLLHILNQYANSENNVIIKSTFGILAVFLRAQELAIWSHSTTKQLFSAILNPFCIHSKPKVSILISLCKSG